MDPREERHRRLLMDISDEMEVDSQEYVKFIYWMEAYVPKGVLHKNKSLLEKLQAMETREHLKVDNYKALKDICEKSGNVNLIDLIEEAEKDICEIGSIQFESESDMKEPLAKKVKYTDTERDLQSDLIEYYREKCSTIPICPCLDEVDAPLLKVYIPPYPLYSQETDKMKQMFKQEKPENKEETETPISSLHDIFNKQSDECRNIYLTAEPGLGKTSFVKWLALNWCQAHSPDNDKCCHFKDNEVRQMQHFEFLFLIFLRETDKSKTQFLRETDKSKTQFLRETDKSKTHIDSMIKKHIVRVLGRKSAYKAKLLERVMCNKKCLIILDGLDEWSALEIPERSVRKNCTYLTTSRPWKFCMLSLDSRKIDQHVCIKNVEKMCAINLILSIFSLLSERKCLRDDVSNPENACQLFREMLSKKNITHFYCTPVVLVQLICLWNRTKKIGNSQCEIYTDIVDTLFSIAERKVELLDRFKDKRTSSIKYFHDLSSCETYYDLMIKLGNLAFETLFSENKEPSLVFDEAVALKHLAADINTTAVNILSACVQTGLLSKQMVYVRARTKTYTNSFYHKTIQEYFAALYIQAEYGDNVHIREIIRRRCNTVSKILEMGTVFTFLSGLCPGIAVEILQSLQTVINEDEITQVYRCRPFNWFHEEKKQMELIQDLMVSCIRESEESGHGRHCFPLEDIIIIIGEKYNQALYCSTLKTLIKLNSKKIKSLNIGIFSPDNSELNDAWKHYEFQEMKCISKLQISVTNSFPRSWAIKLSHLVPNIMDHIPELQAQKLESLILALLERVTHSSLERLFHFVSHQTLLKKIDLIITCSEHRFTDCTGLQLNLCQQEHLQELQLFHVPVSELQLNKHLQKLVLCDVPVTRLYVNKQLQCIDQHDASRSQHQGFLSSLVYCDVSGLPVGVASALFRCLPEDSKLQTLKCLALESLDILALLDTVAKLLQLESIELKFMDLDEKALPLSSNMEHIRSVVIGVVTLTSSTLNNLVATAIRYKQPIKVELYLVTVEDSSTGVEQETTSQDGLPLHSGRDKSCGNSSKVFKFVTVKISSKAFRHFVEMVEKCQHPVEVEILADEPKDIIENYREGIEYVKSSPSFIVLVEETNRYFKFQTTGDQHGVI